MALVAALVLASVAPMWPLISGRCMIFMLDALHQHLAWQVSLSRVLAAAPASAPGWNPYMFGGCPLLADPQMQAAYPPALLYRFLPLAVANGSFLSLHIVLATVGTGLFLRGQGLSLAACLGGAVSFGLGLHAVLLMACAPVLCAFAWLPWVCLSADRLARQPSVAAGGAVAVVMAWMALAGSPQYVVYAVTAATIVVIARSSLSLRRLGALWGAVAAGLTAAAIMLIPFIRYLPHTTRAAALSPGAVVEDAAVARDFLGYVAPGLAMPRGAATSPLAGDRWVRLHCGGILLLPLACVGLFSPGGRRARFGAAALIAVGVLFAMAPGTGWGGWLATVPPFTHMRRAGLWLVLADFGLSWLAAMGIQRLAEKAGGVSRVSGLAAAGMLAMFMYADVVSCGARVHWTAPAAWLTGVSVEEAGSSAMPVTSPGFELRAGLLGRSLGRAVGARSWAARSKPRSARSVPGWIPISRRCPAFDQSTGTVHLCRPCVGRRWIGSGATGYPIAGTQAASSRDWELPTQLRSRSRRASCLPPVPGASFPELRAFCGCRSREAHDLYRGMRAASFRPGRFGRGYGKSSVCWKHQQRWCFPRRACRAGG